MKLSIKARQTFQHGVPFAVRHRLDDPRACCFRVGPHPIYLKSARLNATHQWLFSIRPRKVRADFFVCFCFDAPETEIVDSLLIPAKIACPYQSIVLSRRSKWAKSRANLPEMRAFFEPLLTY